MNHEIYGTVLSPGQFTLKLKKSDPTKLKKLNLKAETCKKIMEKKEKVVEIFSLFQDPQLCRILWENLHEASKIWNIG